MTPLDRVIPALVHIQTHLDDDLKLEGLARLAGVTPSHFSRSFTSTIGESPRAYVERLRLERAAVLLVVRAASILEIALDSGFQSHETFTRAFRRRFGIAPSRWRHGSGSHLAMADANDARRRSLAEELPEGSLSPTTIRTLRSLPVLFQRHVGPYDEVPPTAWRRVQAAAASRGIATQGLLLGVAHDAPGLTEPARCRFDACIVVDGPAAAAWRPTNGVGAQLLPGGPFATTTYVGPYSGLADAYRVIVERIMARTPHVELVGLPAIESYHTTVINPDASLNETEIALPVRASGVDQPPMQEEG
jgi:AraC family transcriptional regulator